MEGTYCPGTQCARTHTSLSSPSTTFCGGGFFSPSAGEVSRAGDTVHFGGHAPTSRDVLCLFVTAGWGRGVATGNQRMETRGAAQHPAAHRTPHCTKVEAKVKALSHVPCFATPWTVAHQVPPSMGLSRQGYWSGLPCPLPGDLPHPGIKPGSSALQADAGTV